MRATVQNITTNHTASVRITMTKSNDELHLCSQPAIVYTEKRLPVVT